MNKRLTSALVNMLIRAEYCNSQYHFKDRWLKKSWTAGLIKPRQNIPHN